MELEKLGEILTRVNFASSRQQHFQRVSIKLAHLEGSPTALEALDGILSRLEEVFEKMEVTIEAAIANDSSRTCGGGFRIRCSGIQSRHPVNVARKFARVALERFGASHDKMMERGSQADTLSETG